MSVHKTILIGCAGASCSGKSTLTEWLAKILNVPVIHQDKYFKSDSQIPIVNGIQHWDCPEALDIPAFVNHLKSAKTNALSESHLSPNRPVIADSDITPEILETLVNKASSVFRNSLPIRGGSADGGGIVRPRIALVDGFLMLQPPFDTLRELDFVLFLHARHDELKERRDRRTSYVTLEGTWSDPPGYWDEFVYPAYLKYNERVLKELTPGLAVQTVCVNVSDDLDKLEEETKMKHEKGENNEVNVHALDSGKLSIADMVTAALDIILSEVGKIGIN